MIHLILNTRAGQAIFNFRYQLLLVMFSDLVHYGALSCKLVLLSYYFSVTINNAYIAK